MGRRASMALTESEYIQIKNAILNKAHDNMKIKLLCFFEIMTKTGIRPSEWKYLARAYKENETKMLRVFIPKQSKLNKAVTRTVKLPSIVWQYVSSGEYKIEERGKSWITQKTDQIKRLIIGEKFDRPLCPSDFRATFVTFIKHRGWDIFDAQACTKHANLKSLQHYFKADTDLIVAVYDSLDKDYFDSKNIAILMKRLNVADRENKLLKEKVKILENMLKEGKDV